MHDYIISPHEKAEMLSSLWDRIHKQERQVIPPKSDGKEAIWQTQY